MSTKREAGQKRHLLNYSSESDCSCVWVHTLCSSLSFVLMSPVSLVFLSPVASFVDSSRLFTSTSSSSFLFLLFEFFPPPDLSLIYPWSPSSIHFTILWFAWCLVSCRPFLWSECDDSFLVNLQSEGGEKGEVKEWLTFQVRCLFCSPIQTNGKNFYSFHSRLSCWMKQVLYLKSVRLLCWRFYSVWSLFFSCLWRQLFPTIFLITSFFFIL